MMQVLWHAAFLVLFAITASLPAGEIKALAALTAGLRIESILFLPAIAFNMTASILVGHYLGQGDVQGSRRIGWKTWGLGCTLITCMGGLVWIYAPELAAILSKQEAVQEEILNYLYFNILAIPFTGTSLIIGGIFIGSGATRYNMWCIGGSVWGVRLPLAYVLGHVILAEAIGIWAAMLVSQGIQATAMFCIFVYKDWPKFSMRARKFEKQVTGVQHGAHLPASVNGKTNRV
jgi:Na+-driven multidrug efflux pump